VAYTREDYTDYDGARKYYGLAAETFLNGESYINAGEAYRALGDVVVALSEYDRAIEYYVLAAETFLNGEQYYLAGWAYEPAGNVAKEKGDCPAALSYWEKAKACYDLAGTPYTVPPCGLQVNVDTPEKGRTYEQGEAVTIAGRVLYADKRPPSPAKLVIEVTVPNCSAPPQGRMTKASTDASGRYSIMPFAGWNIGEYKIRVTAQVWLASEKKYIRADSTVSCQVVKAVSPEDIRAQVKSIKELYESQIPQGPIRKDPPFAVPESMYGSYHNMFLDGKWWADPKGHFTCGGYQAQVLAFLDRLRFHENADVRLLVKGLDYGPIARGLYIFGGHHAVVVYPMGREWDASLVPERIKPVVFDPWPRQKPEVYYIIGFVAGYGFLRVDPYYKERTDPNREIWSGYPLTGGVVYVNFAVTATGQKPPSPKISAIVQCPVDVLVTDEEGMRAGMLSDGSMVQEFPAHVYHAVEQEEVLGWYFGLLEGVYHIVITGKTDGIFRLLVGGEALGGECLSYGHQSITQGAQAYITLDPSHPNPSLSLPDGRVVTPTEVSVEDKQDRLVPREYGLLQNVPNPFNPTTTITYDLPKPSEVILALYSITGQKITLLVDGYQDAGNHAVLFDGTGFANGVYLYRLQAGNFLETKQMLLIK
jgi:hypothetical protein